MPFASWMVICPIYHGTVLANCQRLIAHRMFGARNIDLLFTQIWNISFMSCNLPMVGMVFHPIYQISRLSQTYSKRL